MSDAVQDAPHALQVFAARVAGAHFGQHGVAQRADGRQRVADLVSEAGHHLPERGQTLDAPELHLVLAPRGQVARIASQLRLAIHRRLRAEGVL